MKIPYRLRKRYVWTLRALQRRLSQITVVGCLSILLTFFLTQTHITINQTPSLSYRVFICINGLVSNRSDFVSIQDHPTTYFEGLHYTKRLIGLPGDRIHIKGNKMFVADTLIGPLQKATQDGSLLQPNKIIVVPQGSLVSQGHVFVSGDHPRSFDSRYEEFGLVKEEHIKGRCFGLWPSAEVSYQNSVIRRVSLPKKQNIKGEK